MENKEITSYIEQHQSDIWILINIIIPIIPIGIGGIIRIAYWIAYSEKLTWTTLIFTTISASDLAICISLLSLLIFLSLIRKKDVLNNEDKETEKIKVAIIFLIIILLSIFLYTAITIGNTITNDHEDEKYLPTLHFFDFIVFMLTLFTLKLSCSTQRSFKLKADIL